jgi:hypothetical protein
MEGSSRQPTRRDKGKGKAKEMDDDDEEAQEGPASAKGKGKAKARNGGKSVDDASEALGDVMVSAPEDITIVPTAYTSMLLDYQAGVDDDVYMPTTRASMPPCPPSSSQLPPVPSSSRLPPIPSSSQLPPIPSELQLAEFRNETRRDTFYSILDVLTSGNSPSAPQQLLDAFRNLAPVSDAERIRRVLNAQSIEQLMAVRALSSFWLEICDRVIDSKRQRGSG